MLDINIDDPEKLPLPDLRLLGMQWGLNRISGAGSPEIAAVVNCNDKDDNDRSDDRLA